MLIFKRGHTHVSQEDLSEYLDGRVSEADSEKIDRRLAECADCRQELDALRSTVSLVQRIPELALPRSFVMPGPPPSPVAIRPPAPLRMPQWFYSGAAATAVLVLAILISADATGLLAPDAPSRALESTVAVQAVPESFQGDGAEAAVEMAAPLAPVAELSVPAEQSLSVTANQEMEIAEAEAKAHTLRQAAAAPQAAAEMATKDDSEAAAPMAAMAEAPAPEAADAESTRPPPIAALAAAETEEIAMAATIPPPTVASLAAPAEPALAVQEPSKEIPSVRGTSMLWRMLEGLTAAAALVFIGSWLLRRRSVR